MLEVLHRPLETKSSGTAKTSTESGKVVQGASVRLGGGTWLMRATFTWASNSTGRRGAAVGPSEPTSTALTLPAASGDYTKMEAVRWFTLDAEKDIYAWSYQNSGGALACYTGVSAIRLG